VSRRWLVPLVPLYAAGLAGKNLGYERGWFKARRIRHPVVSIGNLSVGGSGKTPLTIRLAELLTAEDLAVDVLSRGYGRISTVTERVDPAGSANRYGDEPLLIARRASVPVYVGASRYQAGLLAELEISSQPGSETAAVHLLDDGFQHRQLARDADVVVLHRSDFLERLLPAGRLREPLIELRRADFVVLREEDGEFERELRRLNIEAPIWWMRRTIELTRSPQPVATKTEPMVAFGGVARPQDFFQSLTGLGVLLARTISFPDHHSYTLEDAKQLAKVCTESQADAFVTTEKDEVKLDAEFLQVLEEAAPIRVARLSVSLQDEEAVVRRLRAKLSAS
jgi:tetraacyldisaccharide 4'-kinase